MLRGGTEVPADQSLELGPDVGRASGCGDEHVATVSSAPGQQEDDPVGQRQAQRIVRADIGTSSGPHQVIR